LVFSLSPVGELVEPLTFSQTTREVHTAYPNRIECHPFDRTIN